MDERESRGDSPDSPPVDQTATKRQGGDDTMPRFEVSHTVSLTEGQLIMTPRGEAQIQKIHHDGMGRLLSLDIVTAEVIGNTNVFRAVPTIGWKFEAR